MTRGADRTLDPGDIVDPWGRAYRLHRTPGGFEIVTLGADGRAGGTGEDADIRQ